MSLYRTHTCGELRLADVGKTVRLSGWVHNRRDHGGLAFIDLRDNYGLTQLVLHAEAPDFNLATTISKESVIQVEGMVISRLLGTVNDKLPTGEIEVSVVKIVVLSLADDVPVPVFGEPDYPEELRLKHRYLDLRRETLHRNILLRSDVISYMRSRMLLEGFKEFQTPILTASSPEGARDFLVPSRLHPGKFYALPQAPQQFKQLLMVSGFDKYFQIAPCFRDEAARSDRTPGEFYQLDMEMSFVEQEDIFQVIEPVLLETFWKFAPSNSVISSSFPCIPYREAIRRYGTDKPDLRNLIEMQNVSEIFRDAGFSIFANILKEEGTEVWAIPAPGGSSGAFCNAMNSWAIDNGLPGMGYVAWRENGPAGPIAKALGEANTAELKCALALEDGDAAFFMAGKPNDFYKLAGQARTIIGEKCGQKLERAYMFCWIVDFPMYELDDNGKVDFSHNPFSMPQGELESLNTKNPLDILAYQYDIVCNGIEICSGGIRNHRPEVMLKAFELAGYGADTVEEKFGGMLNAFRYGAPPHGGLALGLDRIIMLLAEVDTIREVIAFPLNQQGQDLMMNAPSEVTSKQLKELSIRI